MILQVRALGARLPLVPRVGSGERTSQPMSTASQVQRSHQHDVDDMVARVRAEMAGGTVALFKPPAAPPLPSDSVIDSRICDELESVRREIDQIADVLSNDMDLLTRHATELQALDKVDQILGHLAQVLARADKQAAVETIGMGDLRARLLGRPLS